jgi:hypothetical protein
MASIQESLIEEKSKAGEFRATLDPIHSGIKLAEMGSFFGGGFLAFVGTSILIPTLVPVAALIGLGVGAGSSIGLGRYLKSHWPSGREFVADSERIAITKHGKHEAVVDAQQQVNVLAWYFDVKKDHPRARKGWHLLGLALEQEDSMIIVYSAIAPKDFEKLPLAKIFTKLERKNNEKTSQSASGMRRAGEQRRLYEAEVIRQMEGGDMETEKFVALLDFLQANYPRWMIS